MNKVTIEITAEGWKTTVSLNNKTLTEIWVLDRMGAGTIQSDLTNKDDVSDEEYELLDAINGLDPYDVAKALKHLKSE